MPAYFVTPQPVQLVQLNPGNSIAVVNNAAVDSGILTTQQLAIAGFRVDVLQLMRDMYQVGEWKDAADIIVKMSDEEQQRASANSPAALTQMKVQGAQQQQQQKHNDQLEVVDAENVARAGREVLRSALEKSETPEDLTGGPSPTNVGFTQG